MAKLAPLAQCMGIDVSKKQLEVCFSNLESDRTVRIRATKKFDNNPSGFQKLKVWTEKNHVPSIELRVILEATGVYHEAVTYFLHGLGFCVSVILGSQANAYARSLNTRDKNDRSDARCLAQFGLERSPAPWKPASQSLQRLKRFCRERTALIAQKTAALNQAHARDSSYLPEKDSQKRGKQLVQFLEKQIEQIDKAVQVVIDADSDLKRKIDNICQIKGLGLLTVITIIAETDGFALFKSKGQVVCYAGYDVISKQSGSSVQSIARISRKGNSHIRRALYFPALSAVRSQGPLKDLFDRVFQKSFIKMKAYVAVQRKLLVLIYTLFKKDVPFDLNLIDKKVRQELCPA